jgi:hypothetical protein
MGLRRVDFIAVTELTRERYDNNARRDLLALSKDTAGERGGFSWFEAFLQIAIDDLCGGPKLENRSAAKETIVAAGPAIAKRWPDIAASAADPSLPEIIWVRLTHADEFGMLGRTNLVGTNLEVGAAMAAAPTIRQVDGGSATACAAILLKRAEAKGFIVPNEFFTDVPTFVADHDDAISAMWATSVAGAVQRSAKVK